MTESSAANVADVDLSPMEQKHWDVQTQLEHGFVPDGRQPNFVRAVGTLFDWKSNDVRSYDQPLLESLTFSETTIEEQSTAISASMTVGASTNYGALAFSAAISVDTNANFVSQTRTQRTDQVTRSRQQTTSLNHHPARADLHPRVQAAFDTSDPESIYSTYGAFWADYVEHGAVLRTTVQREVRSNEDTSFFSSSVETDVRYLRTKISTEASGSVLRENSATRGTTETRLTVVGGNVNLWFGSTVGDSDVIVEAWRDSITAANTAPIHYHLRPLSELIRMVNPEKAEEFDEYCNSRWESETEDAEATERNKPLGAMQGVYRVYQQSSRDYLDAFEGVQDHTAVTRPPQDNPSQYWQFIHLSDIDGLSWYRIRQLGTNVGGRFREPRYLTAYGSRQNDFDVVTRPYSGDNIAQEWVLTATGSQVDCGMDDCGMEFQIQHGLNSKYLDGYDSPQSTHRVVTRSQQHDSSQLWVLEPLRPFQVGQARGLLEADQ